MLCHTSSTVGTRSQPQAPTRTANLRSQCTTAVSSGRASGGVHVPTALFDGARGRHVAFRIGAVWRSAWEACVARRAGKRRSRGHVYRGRSLAVRRKATRYQSELHSFRFGTWRHGGGDIPRCEPSERVSCLDHEAARRAGQIDVGSVKDASSVQAVTLVPAAAPRLLRAGNRGR